MINPDIEVSCFTSTKDGIYYGTNSGCILVNIHSAKVLSITPISNSKIITTFSDGTIKIIGPSLKVEDTLKDNSNPVWKAIEIGKKLYSIGSDNTLKIWAKKKDKNYKVEESIEIKGNPKDIKKLNENEVIVSAKDNNCLVFVNLKTKEQKILEDLQNFQSLDNSLFLIDNKNNDDDYKSKEKDSNKIRKICKNKNKKKKESDEEEDNSEEDIKKEKKKRKKKDSDDKDEEKEKNSNIVLVEKNSLKLINLENKQIIFTFDNKDKNILSTTCEKNILTTTQFIKEKNLIGRVIYMVENNKIIKIKEDKFVKNTYDLLDPSKYFKIQSELNLFFDKEYILLNPNNYNLITRDEDFKFFSLNINNNVIITYELLYKASIDGEDASVFHSKCDEKGATITVLKVLDGSQCGGYTPLSWKNDGCWQKDPSLRSFVCNLDNKTKFNLRENYNHALDFHANKLSCFGGYTLQLTDKNLSQKNGICQAQDYQIQSPFDLIGRNESDFQAVDIEIFLVKE